MKLTPEQIAQYREHHEAGMVRALLGGGCSACFYCRPGDLCSHPAMDSLAPRHGRACLLWDPVHRVEPPWGRP